MSYVLEYTDGPYRMLELVEEKSGTSAKLCPERGGIVTGYAPFGEELFYLDRETFLDPKANIRGGNPVLFPISGQLQDGAYEWEGKRYAMRNHGLARISPWTVEDKGVTAEGEPYARLRLTSTEPMLESYPFAFELVFTYLIRDAALVVLQEYRNLSPKPMPMYPGFHPYFATSIKKLEYRTDATRMLDYNDGETKVFGGDFDIGPLQESVALLDAKAPRISFYLPESKRNVVLEYSEAFRYVVIWTAAGKDFVCVEPWMALNAELSRGAGLVLVEPGEALEAQFSIRTTKEPLSGA
jgi:galactose mutarotase-like enzyme